MIDLGAPKPKSLYPKREVTEMLTVIRQRAAYLILPFVIVLMLLGAPTVVPAYADCGTTTSACSV